MKQFYLENKQIPALEGVVEEATGYFNSSQLGQFSLELKLDTFKKPVIVAAAYNLRIDKGEKVRVYSRLGFDRPVNACGGLISIDALQVMDGEEVLFQYIGNQGGYFKE
jgi:hypothetical protein